MSEIKPKCENCAHFAYDPCDHMPEWFCVLGNTDGPPSCEDYSLDIDYERDEEAVSQMAILMRTKLAIKRGEGRSGWWDESRCQVEFLAELLVEHLHKGDPVDVANFAMMLKHRGGGEAMRKAIESALAQAREEERERCAKVADDRESQWRRNGYTEAGFAASQIASRIRALSDEPEGR